MKKQILVFAAALAVLTSCKKDEEDNKVEQVKTKAEILTDGQWDIKYFYTKTIMADTVAYEDTDTINGTALFKPNKELVSNTPELGVEQGTWELVGDSIYLDDQGMYIEELTDKKFVFSTGFISSVVDSIEFDVYLQFTLTR